MEKSEDPGGGETCSSKPRKALKKWSYIEEGVGEDGLDGCVEFVWLGCGGTRNRFNTEEECEKVWD